MPRRKRRAQAVGAVLAGVALVAAASAPAGADAAPQHGVSALAPRAGAWHPIPSYAAAAHDEPITYRNGCHAGRAAVVPRACTFAKKTGPRTVLLYGDSHAAHWHAAVLASAQKHGWRMLTLTKSSCPAADVPVMRYMRHDPYPECSAFRARALRMLATKRWGRVDVAIISNWHFHTVLSSLRGRVLSGAAKVRAWEAGMRRTLAAVLKGAGQVVLLRDSPDLPGVADTARACYARWGLAAQRRCGAPTSKALNRLIWAAELRAAASFPGRVVAIDLTTPYCTGGWCGPVSRPYLAFKDDNHWTQTFMRAHFAMPVDEAIVAAVLRANPPPAPAPTPTPTPPPVPVAAS